MKRTTIVADESLLLELKHRAKREGRTVSELIREALESYSRYSRRSKKTRTLSFVGAGRSGRNDISEKSKEILEEAFKKGR